MRSGDSNLSEGAGAWLNRDQGDVDKINLDVCITGSTASFSRLCAWQQKKYLNFCLAHLERIDHDQHPMKY